MSNFEAPCRHCTYKGTGSTFEVALADLASHITSAHPTVGQG